MSTTGAAPARIRPPEVARTPPGPVPHETLAVRQTVSGAGKRSFEVLVDVLERVADIGAVVLALFTARAIYEALHVGRHVHYPFRLVACAAAVFALLFVYLMDWDGGYQRGYRLLRVRETERILRTAAKAFLLVFPVTFLVGQMFSRWLLVLAVLIVPLFLIAEKEIFWRWVRSMHARGRGVENVLI